MLFSSVTFLFYFLPLFLLAYAVLPCANLVLLAGSLLFYGWGDPARLPLLLACILLNWGFGLLVARRRRGALVLGIVGNLVFLIWFKYAGFLATQTGTVAGWLGLPTPPVPDIALPLGISFFTFQGISYLVDVHCGIVQAQPSLLKFAMYKSMFPPLIAGPIVRYAQVADRVDRRHVTLSGFERGVESFIIGLAQKVLLANTLDGPVDRIFALPPDQLGPGVAWLGVFAYGLQLFFDFAGYSNMAIGLGRMLGFELPVNFDRPYAARSVTEFWRRWHITLTSWFRDYVYIPLGGNRHGSLRTMANLVSVFLLCGLWHGASWSFVLWGLYHGGFLMLERCGFLRLLAVLPRAAQHVYLVLAVSVGWVLFRADTLAHADTMLRAMLGTAGPEPMSIDTAMTSSIAATLICGATLAVWPGGQLALPAWLHSKLLRPVGCLGLLVLSCASLAAGSYNPFLYFRF